MDYARVRAVADELSARSESWAVEISGDEIITMTSPAKQHEFNARKLRRLLEPQVEASHPGCAVDKGPDVEDVRLGSLRRPDVMAFIEAALAEPGPALDPKDILMVAEIVSKSNPDNDYSGKLRDCPEMGVPTYLIVDPRNGAVKVCTGIVRTAEGDRYRDLEEYTFGEVVAVGGWSVDSSRFIRYTGSDE